MFSYPVNLWSAILIFLRYMYFFKSKNKYLISMIWILDIKKNSWYPKKISCYKKIYFVISENQFLISQTQVLDFKKWFSDVPTDFLISRIKVNFWYQKLKFLISENHSLISKNTSKICHAPFKSSLDGYSVTHTINLIGFVLGYFDCKSYKDEY